MDQVTLRTTCRACGERLQEVLSLGNLRLNAFPKTLEEIDTIPRVSLVLMVCKGCGLVQLERTVPPDWMFRTYYYRSGINEMMRAELRSIVEEALDLVVLERSTAVLDIGANDGTLLAQYDECLGMLCPWRTAVEPARNLQELLAPHADVVFNTYFPDPAIVQQYTIITAIACSYDLEDPLGFFHAIHDRLDAGGVAVIQFQDFGQQIETAAFDNIVHEHLEYYTVWSLSHIFRQVSLTMQRVVTTPINGGSLRIFLRRQEDAVRPEQSVADHLLKEARQGLDTITIREGKLEAFDTFKRRVAQVQTHVRATLEIALEQGCVIDLLGASTKGNVLLQVLGIGPGQVRQAIDRDPTKDGCFTITGIPIVGEAAGRVEAADLWLCNIWQFKASLLQREADFLQRGGTMLFPLPYAEIVKADWKVRS